MSLRWSPIPHGDQIPTPTAARSYNGRKACNHTADSLGCISSREWTRPCRSAANQEHDTCTRDHTVAVERGHSYGWV